jgi:hypothetical protein
MPTPPPVEIEGEQEYFIERIKDSQMNKRCRRLEYLIRWVGYDEPTWEPASEFKDTTVVVDFRTRYPNKPQDQTLKNPESTD